jgi:glycosyltransferase involved in cell wall biosynthesis
LKILLLHNRYQIPGGEDTAVGQESAMLRAAGLDVEVMETDNDGIVSLGQKVMAAVRVPYSFPARRSVQQRIAEFRPDIVHVHNFFPMFTPSVYDACRDARVPVVQTLHNYRLMCANALLFRDGAVCTDCLGRVFPVPAIRHSCYRESKLGSTAVAAMISVHQIRHTWTRRVHRFIALTEFARALFTTNLGIPSAQVEVKPNAVADPGCGNGSGGYALYVGRLSAEKGIETLLRAAKGAGLGMPLKIAGTGPLQQMVENAQSPGQVEYLGFQTADAVHTLMKRARVLMIPSLWFEGLPMVVPEAYATGLPIIASRIGALATLVRNGENGLQAEPGDASALAAATRQIASDSAFEASLRRAARQTYDAEYRPEANVQMLLTIYEHAARAASAGS